MSHDKIIVVLDESIHAKGYPISTNDRDSSYNRQKSTLIHREEFEKVCSIIAQNIPNSEDEWNQEYLHNTITVRGSRGSGKTSFLLAVRDYLRGKNNMISHPVKNISVNTADIEVLEIIDPTLIEEKEHVFFNVIALIKDLVDKKMDNQECNPHQEGQSGFNKKEWRTALANLAAGLPSIDNMANRNTDGWQDPEFMMDNGLRDVTASQKLTKNFNIFLRISLDILKKKVFLLMFDDIDVEAKKGWNVLETIRKYFTGARLITIVSGDMELYGTVVRQRKWESFEKEILEYEGKMMNNISKFNDMVIRLESQYLQKILQTKNRTHLLTIGEKKVIKPKTQIFVYKNSTAVAANPEEQHEISSRYKKILEYFGIKNSYQADAYASFLLRLPLRTQLQFLDLFNLDSGEYETSEAGTMPIADIFSSELYAKQVNIYEDGKNIKNLNRIILKFLLKEKKLEELYQLQPITTEEKLNASLISLNFILSYNMQQDPFLVFDYFIKVGYIRNLLPLIGYKDSREGPLKPSIEDLCNNTVILNDNVLKDVVGKITAYIRGIIDSTSSASESISKAGTIPIFGLAAKQKQSSKYSSDRIDKVLKTANATDLQTLLVNMPLSTNQYTYKQSSLLTYSSYLLLSSIGELVRKVQLHDEQNGFIELSQLRAYMMPDFKRANIEADNDTEAENIDNGTDSKDEISQMAVRFSSWVNNFPKGTKISAHLLGKISTRFYYALTNLENKARNKTLGEIFPAHITAFMNAVLVEEYREEDIGKGLKAKHTHLNLNNTNYKPAIFVSNLIKVNGLTGKPAKTAEEQLAEQLHEEIIPVNVNLPLSRWMLSCPLLIVYLNTSTELEEQLKSFCGGLIDNSIFEIKLNKFLDNITTKSEINDATKKTP